MLSALPIPCSVLPRRAYGTDDSFTDVRNFRPMGLEGPQPIKRPSLTWTEKEGKGNAKTEVMPVWMDGERVSAEVRFLTENEVS